METFSALLAICAGNSPVPVNSPHKGQWRGALMFSLISAWINSWVNNREAGDLRRNRAHYDVIVMSHDRVSMVVADCSAYSVSRHLYLSRCRRSVRYKWFDVMEYRRIWKFHSEQVANYVLHGYPGVKLPRTPQSWYPWQQGNYFIWLYVWIVWIWVSMIAWWINECL